MRRLTAEADAERGQFTRDYGDGNCSCHISPPCDSYLHPGNPMNQDEDPTAWETLPDNYVAGFMFNQEMNAVALIRKRKPDWQKNKLNGIGGIIEPTDASSAATMAREFLEETGYSTMPEAWSHFHHMSGTNDDGEPFSVEFFTVRGDLELLASVTQERVEIVCLLHVNITRRDLVENVSWLIGAAYDHLGDGRPKFTTSTY